MSHNKPCMIYIHVPFCASRCIYCDFYSTTHTDDYKNSYVEAACAEMESRREEVGNNIVQSVYLGGGTPSQLSVLQIECLLQKVNDTFTLSNEAEITIEANPDDINANFVKDLKSLGINRMSLGVQSFNNDILRLLNRRHNAQEACKAVETIQQNGIDNISIDLIYGLPSQTIEGFSNDLTIAFQLPIKHLSSYALSVEESTMLDLKIKRGELTAADEDIYIDAYNRLLAQATAHGFEHYEISNFALPHYESRHNTGYWCGLPYLGIGPGAHSFDGCHTRRYNRPNLKKYVEAIKNEEAIHDTEVLTLAEQFDELLFTSLRTRKGLDLNSCELQRFPNEWVKQMYCDAEPHLQSGRLSIQNNRLCITRMGIMTSNDIISDLMRAEL